MKSFYLTYGIRELKKRPMAFASGFLACLCGMLVTFSMLFMQYGAYTADVRLAEEKYHICLPYLTEEDIANINGLSYVKEVYSKKDGDTLTAYIRVEDNDPYRLKDRCDDIIRQTGIGKKPEYLNNTYYHMYGPQDNWINTEYYKLVTDNFFLRIAPFICLLSLLTALAVFVSVRLKVKTNAAEYAAMRSYGYGTRRLINLIRAQYTAVFHVAALIALGLAAALLKLLEYALEAFKYADNFQQFDFVAPLAETAIVYIFTYALTMLFIGFCRPILSGNICSMLNGAVSERTARLSKGRSKKDFVTGGMGKYNFVYTRRYGKAFAARILKKCVLLILPVLFVFLAVGIYGMRAQAQNAKRDFGIHSGGRNYVTDNIVEEVETIVGVESVTVYNSYGNGTHNGMNIFCADGAEEQLSQLLSDLADRYGLLFTDEYHDSALVIKQSNMFTAFFMTEAFVLFAAALSLSLADAEYSLRRRTREIAVIKALGADEKQLARIYAPDVVVAAISFLTASLAVVAVGMLSVGMPYFKPLFAAAFWIAFAVLYLGGHCLVCARHKKRITERSIIVNINDVSA